MNKCLFLSCATREFAHVRDQFTDDFRRPAVDTKSHEEVADFVSGGTTLEKLDDYISGCDAVIHLLGQASGTQVKPAEITAILRRHSSLAERLPQVAPLLTPGAPWRGSYTQWEAYLALFHWKRCFVFRVVEGFERPEGFAATPVERQLQDEHHHRLEGLGHDRDEFASREELRLAMQRSLGEVFPTPQKHSFRLTTLIVVICISAFIGGGLWLSILENQKRLATAIASNFHEMMVLTIERTTNWVHAQFPQLSAVAKVDKDVTQLILDRYNSQVQHALDNYARTNRAFHKEFYAEYHSYVFGTNSTLVDDGIREFYKWFKEYAPTNKVEVISRCHDILATKTHLAEEEFQKFVKKKRSGSHRTDR